jgi:hypothetical protein
MGGYGNREGSMRKEQRDAGHKDMRAGWGP